MSALRKRRTRDAPMRKRKKLISLLEDDPLHADIDWTSERTIKKVLKLDPNNALFHYEFAKMISGYDRVRASAHFMRALELDPQVWNQAEFHFALSKVGCTKIQCKCKSETQFHQKEAAKLDPQNAEFLYSTLYLVESSTTNWLERISRVEEFLWKVVALDPLHARACFGIAKKNCPTHGYDWHQIREAKASEADYTCLKNAFKSIETFRKSEQAEIHAMLGCMHEIKKNFNAAKAHFDLALLLDPKEAVGNYWKFLCDHTQEKELVSIVRHIAKSFRLRDDTEIVDLFQKYSLLTPGYRALVKKNNPVVMALMRKYAKRETQWISMLFPFNEEFFPTVVTKAVLDFLFHL